MNEAEWEAGDKESSRAQVTPTALRGNVCVCMGSTCEELCWLLTHILSPASSHGTNPGRMSCERSLIPAHRPGVSAGQGAPKGPSWGWGSVQLHTHAKALTHEPKSHQI